MTDSILSYLVETHLKTALLVGVAWVAADLVFRKASASVRHAFLAVGFAAALAVPLMAFVPASMLRVELPVVTSASTHPVGKSAPALAATTPGRPTLDRPMLVSPVAVQVPAATVAKQKAETLSSRKGPEAARAADWKQASALRDSAAAPLSPVQRFLAACLGWLALVWALGAAYHLVRLAVLHGLVAWHSGSARRLDDPDLEHLARRYAHAFGLTSPLRLLASDRVCIPYMHGLRTITIVLPTGCMAWDRERWELVLKHELAHAHRRDYVWQCLATLACALHWFNPLFWRATTRLRLESERACDDIVVASGARPSSYARLLADFACLALPRPEASAALAITRRHDLVLRVEAILDPATPRLSQGINPMKRCILLSALLVAALTLIDVRLVAGGPEGTTSAAKAKASAPADGLFESSVPINDLGEAWFALGWEAHGAGDFEYSSVAFMKAFDREYNVHLAAYNSACAFARLGRPDDAFRWLEAAIDSGFGDRELFKSDEDLASLRADARFAETAKKMGKVSKPKATVIVEKKPGDKDARFDLATLDRMEAERRAASRGEWENMIAVSKDLADDLADNTDVHFRLGYAYLMLNQPAEAKAHFEKCLEGDMFDGMANYNLACVNATLGDTDAAFGYFEKAAESWGTGALQMQSDYDLRSLRGDERFAALVKELETRQHSVSWSFDKAMPALEGLEILGEKVAGLGEKLNLVEVSASVTPSKGFTINPYTGAVIPLTPGHKAEDVPEEMREAGPELFQLALDLHQHGGFAEAIAGFKRCHEGGETPGASAYNVACGLARLGMTDEAFAWLDKAIVGGISPASVEMVSDADLMSLHDDPRFDAALARYEANGEHETVTAEK